MSGLQSCPCFSEQLDGRRAVSALQEAALVAPSEQLDELPDSSCVLRGECLWTVAMTGGVWSDEKPQAIQRRDVIFHAALVDHLKQFLLPFFGERGISQNRGDGASQRALSPLNFGVGPLERCQPFPHELLP